MGIFTTPATASSPMKILLATTIEKTTGSIQSQWLASQSVTAFAGEYTEGRPPATAIRTGPASLTTPANPFYKPKFRLLP